MEWGVPALISLIKEGTDFYVALASQVYRTEPSSITPSQRAVIKVRFLKLLTSEVKSGS